MLTALRIFKNGWSRWNRINVGKDGATGHA